MQPVRHYHHQYRFSYITSFKRHFSSTVIILAVLIAVIVLSFRFAAPNKPLNLEQVSAMGLIFATGATFLRLLIAYVLALAVAIPLVLLATASARLEKIFLPVFDILQSIPVLAFFPVIVLVFIKFGLFEASAVFVLVITMVWSLVFSMIGGIKTIPADVESAATVFGARGIKKLTNVTFPAIFPYILTGSLLSWASGWNIIIVAEALHNYIPNSSQALDLYGLGSLLVNASYHSHTAVFLSGLVVMVVLIGLLNFFVWQRLLHQAEKFKFD